MPLAIERISLLFLVEEDQITNARITSGQKLTRVLFCRGTKEDAEPGLEVGRFASGVPPAELDAVGEHEGAGAGVEHVVGRGVHIARDQLEVCVLFEKQEMDLQHLGLLILAMRKMEKNHQFGPL